MAVCVCVSCRQLERRAILNKTFLNWFITPFIYLFVLFARSFCFFLNCYFFFRLENGAVLLSYDWQNGSIPLVEDWRDWRNAGTFIFYTSLAVALVYSWLNRKVS